MIYGFDAYRLDTDRLELWQGERAVAVEPQVFHLLQHLIENRERVVSKDELIEHVWGGRAVSDATLSSRINAARRALGDSGADQAVIRTVVRRGFRFVAEVAETAIGTDSAALRGGGVERDRRADRGLEQVVGHGPQSAAMTLPEKPSIVVLPFDNISGDSDQDSLADGIVEAITAGLSRIRSFFVIARNSAFTYKGRAVDMGDIRRDFNVAYVLEGSVQRAGARVRVTVQLIETEGGAHVWAERYDGFVEDIFDLQDRITEQVAGALNPSIRSAEVERARRKRPQDLGAYDYTMRSMPHVWALDDKGSANALALLGKALAIDPDYPLALALASWCHGQRVVYYWSDDITVSRAEALRLAEKAVALSGDDPLILAVLGAVQTFVHNYGTARALLERAIALDRNAAWAWSRLGFLGVYCEEPESAIEHFERALRLSPLDPMNFNNYFGMGAAHHVAKRYDKAVEFYQRALGERPYADWILLNLASCLVAAGRMDEARTVYRRIEDRYPDLTLSKVEAALTFSPIVKEISLTLPSLGLPL